MEDPMVVAIIVPTFLNPDSEPQVKEERAVLPLKLYVRMPGTAFDLHQEAQRKSWTQFRKKN